MSELNDFILRTVADRVDFGKLTKLKKEFFGVLETLQPVKKFAPRIYIGNELDKKEINTYTDMSIQIYFPLTLKDHISEVVEFVVENIQKKYTVRSLGILYRISLGEDFDIDIYTGRAEDPEFEYTLTYDLEKKQRFTTKLEDMRKQFVQARILTKAIRIWKRHKLLNIDYFKLEKSYADKYAKMKPISDYGKEFEEFLKATVKDMKTLGLTYENKKVLDASEESLQAIQDRFWMKVLF
jgi:hypothetical protein